MNYRFRQIMKRLFIGFLSMVMMCSCMLTPAYAWAESNVYRVTGEGLSIQEPNGISADEFVSRGTARNGQYNGEDGSSITWTLTSAGALTVSGSGCLPRIWFDNSNNFFGADIKTVTIQSGITSLDNGAFYQCANITKVTLPDSLTMIGFAAFGECTNLAFISVPSSVSYVGEYAFYSCTALQSITLPSAVTSIDTEAFANCTSLTSASIYGDIGTDAFNNCTSLSSLTINGTPQFISDRAFAYCTSLSSVNVPSSVTEIGFGAFAHCESLTSANIYGNLLESAFDCCYSLKNVVFDESCISIGRRAFAECRSITGLTLPDSLEIIEEGAFQNCTELVSITLPSQLMTLENRTFFGCSSLRSVTIPSSVTQIEEALFANCAALEAVYLHEDITAIYGGAFGNCSALTEISIPDHCSVIGEYAFYGCKALRSVVLPLGLPAVETGTFYECASLENIKIPDSVRIVSDHAFAKCAKLTSVVLPYGLETIGKYSFASCEKLVNIALPDSVMSIGEGVFYNCSSLTKLAIPSPVTVIPEGSLYGCTSLKTLTLNSKIEAIGEWAFVDCVSLKSVMLPDSLKKIGKAAFARCKTIEAVTLPESVTALEDAVFLGCSNLQTVVSKGNILGIGEYTFSDCKSLTTLTGFSDITTVGNYAFANAGKLIHSQYPSLESIGEGAFAYCEGLTELVIGAKVMHIGDTAFAGCTNLENIIVSSANTNFITDGHILYSKDMSRLIACAAKGVPYDVIIPDSVQNISKYAFYQCQEIQRVSLPSGLTSIEDKMFFGCTGIREISIPDTVSSIGAYAFAKCGSLESIVCPTGLAEIGEGAFLGCSSLQDIDFNNCTLTVIPSYMLAGCTSLRNFSIPNTVTLIGEYAFSECSFDGELRIPDSVCKISDFAFKESKGITNVIFPEAVTSLGRCAFDGSEDLSGVSFEGDIYAIGAGAFQNTPLKDAYFSGNAPGVIGKDAFSDSGEGVLLHYNEAGESWTMPVWEGPDGITYRTSTVITGDCGKTLRWKLVTHSGVLTISGTGEMYDSKTPEETPWHEYVSLIQSVVIEEGVTGIGANTFSGIDTLIEVSIPSTVTKVGYGAFANSRNIRMVNTNGGLKAVSKCMFYKCDQFPSIELAEGLTDIGDYAFYNCASLEQVSIPASVRTVGEGAFASCLSLDTLKLNGTLTKIGQGAFFNSAALTSVYILDNPPKEAGSYAFASCNADLTVYGSTSTSWLTGYEGTAGTAESSTFGGTCGEVTWSVDPFTNVLTISGSGAVPGFPKDDTPWYQYNSMIYGIDIRSGVTSIGEYAFAELTNANYVNIPNTVTSIDKYAFAACSSLSDVQLPACLVSLGEGVFSACISLEEIGLPAGITVIPDRAFSECLQLKIVNARSNITQVGYGAFYCCMKLESIAFMPTVQSVGDFAFTMCTALQSIDLSACGSIGIEGFFSCTGLKEVSFSDHLSSMGIRAFSQSGLTGLVVPGSLAVVPECAFELCGDLASVRFEGMNHVIETDAFYGCTALTDLDLTGVVQIGQRAFMACGLNDVHIAQSVAAVGDGAFADCSSLNRFTSDSLIYFADNGILFKGGQLVQFPAAKHIGGYSVPAHVTSIAPYAFYGCEKLVEIGIGNRVESIGEAAFAMCSGLRYVVVGARVGSLPKAAFGECVNLELVRFAGNALSEIGEDAFYNCPESLSFEYSSEAEGWTEGTWAGPDGNNYTVRVNQITIAVVNNFFDQSGSIQANLQLTNNGSTAVTVQSVQIDDERFTVTGEFPLILEGGESRQDVIVCSTESLIGGAVTCMATIETDGRLLYVPVKFTPQDEYYIWARADETEVYAQVFNAAQSDRSICLVAQLQLNNRTIATRSYRCDVPAQGNRNLTVSFGGLPTSPDYQLVLFMLDAESYAPMCRPLEIKGVQPQTGGEDGYVSVAGELLLYSRGVQTKDLTAYTVNEEVAPAETSGHEISQQLYLGEFLISRTAAPDIGTYSYDVTTYDINIKDISELMDLYMRGKKPTADGSTESGQGRADINIKVGISRSTDPFERSLAKVGDEQRGIKFFTFSGVAKAACNLTSFSAKDGFKPANVSVSGSTKGSVAEIQLIKKDFKIWKTNDWKVKVDSSLDVVSVEAGGGVNIDGQGASISGTAGFDSLKMNNKFTFSKGKYELISIGADPGAGASATFSAAIRANKIQIKVGGKAGLGGDVSLEVDPEAILKATFESAVVKEMMGSAAQMICVFNELKDGSKQKIAEAGFVFGEDGRISAVWALPMLEPISLLGSNLYKQALPASQGGTEMPKEILPPATTGSKDTTAVLNNLTPYQKTQLASALLGMPVNVLSGAEMVIRMFELEHWVTPNWATYPSLERMPTFVYKECSARVL